ncbi:MAG: hypothetical protein ACRDPE_02260 [Solirubrobacterales bacterium]
MAYAPCSCGVVDCPELGWPHEWDPIAAGDNCIIVPPPVHVIVVGDEVSVWPPESAPHKVTEPYVRYGSGYACAGCVVYFNGEEV